MNNEGKFIYNKYGSNDIFHCGISYSPDAKSFYLDVYSDDTYSNMDTTLNLFQVKRYSDSYKSIAFQVANMHVLPNLIKSR